jgi:S1-C subfamily serine protease
MTAVRELQDAIAGAAESVGPAVVGLGRGWGLGSGVVIGENRVLTNAHNLRREEVTVTFADGRREAGEAAGLDPDLDLAVISVDTAEAAVVEWDPAPEPPSIGAPVIAL